MPLNIQEYAHQADYVKIALYGESGTGKTRFCSTAEAPLFISSEMKFKSVRRDRVPYIAVQTIADLNVELSALSMNVQGCPYRTICIDSFTDIAERTLKTLTNKDPRQNYAALQVQMEGFFQSLVYVPFDMVIVFQIKAAQDMENYRKYYPSVPGDKVSQRIPYWFDEVFAARKAKAENQTDTVYYIQTSNDGQYVAKDCSDNLRPQEIPDAKSIIERIRAPQNYDTSVPY